MTEKPETPPVDFFAAFGEPKPEIVHAGELVPEPAPRRVMTRAEQKAERLRSLEDELLERSLSIVSDALAFADIAPGADTPPDSWMDDLNNDVRKVDARLRVANGAWMCAKEAPVGISLAKSISMGIVKARATEKGNARPLNVAVVVQATANIQMTYPEQELDVE